MKILIVSDAWHPQINGVVRTYEYLMAELMRMGHQVKVIGPSDFKYSFPMPGYSEIRLTVGAGPPLRQMIQAYAPDLLHIATEGPLGLAARRYALSHGIEFTSCYHTHFPDYAAKRAAKYLPLLYKPVRALGIAYVRWFHHHASCLFVATPSLKQTLEQWGFTCPMKFMTRGIDTHIFYPGTSPVMNDIPRPIALYVGRVAIEKSLPDFLDASWQGSKVVVGDGPDLNDLRAQYPDVHFVGKKTGKDLGDYYRNADVFTFPSRTDTFGMVIIEALACGVPVAAYPVTGPLDIITENFLGCLNTSLAKAMQSCLDPACQGEKQKRIDHIVEHYSWHMAARQFLEII